MMTKPYFELEMTAIRVNGCLLIMPVSELTEGEALNAVKDNIFAEVNIPHHTGDAVYCYTFHIFNRLNHEPAIVEMMDLSNMITKIHRDYGHLCQQVDIGELS